MLWFGSDFTEVTSTSSGWGGCVADSHAEYASGSQGTWSMAKIASYNWWLPLYDKVQLQRNQSQGSLIHLPSSWTLFDHQKHSDFQATLCLLSTKNRSKNVDLSRNSSRQVYFMEILMVISACYWSCGNQVVKPLPFCHSLSLQLDRYVI